MGAAEDFIDKFLAESKARHEVLRDAFFFGSGYWKNGKYVPLEDVLNAPPAAPDPWRSGP